MNYGPLLFLAAFFALAGSWFGFVLTPQAQIGQLQATNVLGGSIPYPQGRPGLARQGLEVYRANGCADCHSQQLRQSGTVCDVVLSAVGTNAPAVLSALQRLKAEEADTLPSSLFPRPPTLGPLPSTLDPLPSTPVLERLTPEKADAAAKALNAAGAKAAVSIVPIGPDLARGWGKRRSVARDFLFDYPVALGLQRIGPDLADLAARQPDAGWHLRHLYAPRLEVKDSAMPPFRFLFETRRIERSPSPDALVLPPHLAPPPGYEIVPKPEAGALVAYLLSLRADAPLFEAPLTLASGPPAAEATNAPAASDLAATNASAGSAAASTNAAPTNAPAWPRLRRGGPAAPKDGTDAPTGNPKPETPKSEGNPRSEIRKAAPTLTGSSTFEPTDGVSLRISAFGFPSDFGLRISDLPSCRYRGKHTHPSPRSSGEEVTPAAA